MSAVRRWTWPMRAPGSMGFGARSRGGTSPWSPITRAGSAVAVEVADLEHLVDDLVAADERHAMALGSGVGLDERLQTGRVQQVQATQVDDHCGRVAAQGEPERLAQLGRVGKIEVAVRDDPQLL